MQCSGGRPSKCKEPMSCLCLQARTVHQVRHSWSKLGVVYDPLKHSCLCGGVSTEYSFSCLLSMPPLSALAGPFASTGALHEHSTSRLLGGAGCGWSEGPGAKFRSATFSRPSTQKQQQPFLVRVGPTGAPPYEQAAASPITRRGGNSGRQNPFLKIGTCPDFWQLPLLPCCAPSTTNFYQASSMV
jgi:hypothetical protein